MSTPKVRRSRRSKWYRTSTMAWERLNEAFVINARTLEAIAKGGALYAYDLLVKIDNPQVDPELDLGRLFNYTKAKWTQLVKNYVDREVLDEVARAVQKEEAENNKSYNIPMAFSNKHKGGKSCLLSMVFSGRVGKDKPNITIFLRASEVTKRLLCDLVLFQRIGEYVYGDTPFSLTIFFNQIFNDDVVLLMYHAHQDLRALFKYNPNDRTRYLAPLFEEYLQKDPKDVKYKVHRRVVKVLRPDLVEYPKTLVKDCIL